MLRPVATEGLGKRRYPRPSRAADEERPNPGEYLAPDKGTLIRETADSMMAAAAANDVTVAPSTTTARQKCS
ncbi:MAG: hypothetical protein JO204_01950 [Alphaproteobacteria bacterium]|nr:hypothetical protein [Alphaproteobacteria bacterium]